MKKQQEVPDCLNKITDVVLSYHPKPKRKKTKKRKKAKRGRS